MRHIQQEGCIMSTRF